MFFRASPVAAAILTVGSVVGFAPAALADVADDSFIQALDGYGMQYGTLDNAIGVAKTYVCGQLAANPSEPMNDVVSGVADNTNWSIADSTFFTGSAITAYCPQYQYIASGPTNVPIS
ncbi:DUF732 domain-containing protein [Mycobacterium sp. 1245805.9]|uniref:DUF732 domain-containing protein n=1 Tax=Mycobacterium sp. 1245805.9 TaxID=1856862 RepID=UPI0007FFDDBC|nr:DUF732 domain-containing protein [Mycobacterium sp. 1245805.9]OBI83766.1 hypothetical protein A9X00_04800 [Mycobacterium sp. 1245805.9]